ncbi:MAG: MoxR family ATPase [Candidatus Gastranaerophilales bacterium]|nr:MoxR family ATPase [Candidatus Gastranaerophilales bacterium]
MGDYRENALAVMEQVNRYILGKEKVVREAMAAFLAGGNILLEDIPGVGKTTLALLFAGSMGLDWRRVQFTPDVMPSDLTGFSIYRKDTGVFEYQKGAVFCNLLLADEINRTTPKTQSALLEAMQEGQVTVEGVTRVLEPPFLVIATQNPLGSVGTQPLPPAQMDRFMVSMTMGYPEFEYEVMMAKAGGHPNLSKEITAVTDRQTFLKMQREVENVFVKDEVYRYMVELSAKSRQHPYIEQGVSPRGTIALVRMSKASAWLSGSLYVSPADVEEQFAYVAGHRILLNVAARMEGVKKEQVIREILEQVKKPEPGKK